METLKSQPVLGNGGTRDQGEADSFSEALHLPGYRAGSTTPERKPWQVLRANFLHEACSLIHSRIQSGERVGKVFESVVRSVNRRRRRLAPGKLLRTSFPNLRRLYRRWLRDPSPQAFLSQFPVQPRMEKVCAAFRQEAVRRCLLAGVVSVQEAYDTLLRDWHSGVFITGLGSRAALCRVLGIKPVHGPKINFPLHYRAFHKLLAEAERRAIRAIHAERRRLRAESNRLAGIESRLLRSKGRVHQEIRSVEAWAVKLLEDLV